MKGFKFLTTKTQKNIHDYYINNIRYVLQFKRKEYQIYRNLVIINFQTVQISIKPIPIGWNITYFNY